MTKANRNWQRPLTWLLALVLAVAALWAVASAWRSHVQEAGDGRLDVGRAAPIFEAVDSEGSQISLAASQGKTVVLNFWASWCEPCVNELPLIERLAQEQTSKVTTLFVNVGESRGTVNEFLTGHGFEFPVILDATGRISELYGVTSLPTTYIIDPHGDIAQPIFGEITSAEQLQAYIDGAPSTFSPQ
ncbi:TlpA family protein disulfide reductase [Paenibacillus senegalimassiliensis]|uniref:TlpA family protein disulfide reductase n=1 Tax=Paenibacillus senegalimassiliensis TaxID=1737426 RepID=UPI00073EFA40|nr:redoxin domain-containing protein [Paenibacillus senegalimassiliensis]